jgi:phytol kinase
MDKQPLWLLLFLSLLLGLMVMSEVLHKHFKWQAERSRKFIHVSGGLLCLLFPAIFTSHWWVLALAFIAFLLLLVTYVKKMLPSVHETKRYSLGSVLFPVPVYICFLMAEMNNNDLYFYLPVSLLAISDTAAEIGGHTQWGQQGKQFFKGQKTLAGSVYFFITALLVNAGWLFIGYQLPIDNMLKIGLLISFFATIAELVTLHGWDNLTVPAVTLLLLSLLL